jgi:DNA-binding transcriptional regulator YiaG
MNATNVIHLALARQYAATGTGARIRTAAQLSLQEVAIAAGCSTTTVWRWEQGQRQPHGEAAVAWVRLLQELESIAGQDEGA